MRKPTKRGHQKRRTKRLPVAETEFQTGDLPTPLDPDAPPKMRRLHRAFLDDAQARYDEDIARLATLVRSTDPLQLLAHMTLKHDFFPAGYDPEALLPDPLTQWPLEWMQGFCLRIDPADFRLGAAIELATVREVESILLRVGATSVAERFRRRDERFGRGPSDRVDGSWEQEQARGARLALRNWSYRPHMVDIVTRLSERLDGWSDAELGYRLSAIPTLLFKVEVEVERRTNSRRRMQRTVVQRSGSPTGMCLRWQRSDLPGADLAYALESELREERLGAAEFLALFDRTIAHHAPGLFTFTIDELEALSTGQLSRDGLEQLMPALSYRFGDLRRTPVEHLTMGNPAWARPFIALEDGSYFCPLPAMGLSHLLDLVGNLVPDEEDVLAEVPDGESEGQRRWGKARSRFLEQRTHEIVAAAFPSASIYPNSKYDDPPVGVDLENDLAVVLDDVVLVLEAKSHRVPVEAWRGAPDAMRESFEELVLGASTQSANFANYLLRVKGPRPFRRKSGGEFFIDSSDIRSAVRANVVLDPFPVVRNMTPNLRQARLLRDGEPDPAPSFLMSTLESVLVLLPDELQRIHYLARRQMLQSNCLMHVEEHDLLALYIEAGFNLNVLEDPTSLIRFKGPLAKKRVDPYLEQWFGGRLRLPRPTRPLQPGWMRFLKQLQDERPPDWVTTGMALLDASANQQQYMLDRITRVVRAVRDSGDAVPIEWWSMDVGLSYWRSSIAAVVARTIAPCERTRHVTDVVNEAGLNENRSCTALVFDVAVSHKNPVTVAYYPAGNLSSAQPCAFERSE